MTTDYLSLISSFDVIERIRDINNSDIMTIIGFMSSVFFMTNGVNVFIMCITGPRPSKKNTKHCKSIIIPILLFCLLICPLWIITKSLSSDWPGLVLIVSWALSLYALGTFVYAVGFMIWFRVKTRDRDPNI